MSVYVVELLWTLPIVGFVFLIRRKLYRFSESIWVVFMGALIGALYAYVIALFVGPAVQGVALPFPPVAMTCGAAAGITPLGRDRPALRGRLIFVCFAVVLIVWIAFFTIQASLQKKESFRLVVIKLSGESQPLHWAKDLNSVSLNREEIEATEKATRTVDQGALMPVSSFGVGREVNATVILVMQRDVSDRVRLAKPNRGLVTYVQNADGSWQSHDANTNGYSLILSPAEGTGFTRIEVEGAMGVIASEVGVSHK